MNELSNFELLRMIYFAARSEPAFNKNNYFWKLGVDVIRDLGFLNLLDQIHDLNLDEDVAQLFGIDVDVDYVNTSTIRLFKDVTENYLGTNKTTL